MRPRLRARANGPAAARRRRAAMPALLVLAAAACAVPAARGAGPASTADVQRITLAAAIDNALNRNRDLALLARGVETRRLAVAQAWTAFGVKFTPSVSAEAGSERGAASYGLALSRKTLAGTRVAAGALLETDRPDAGDDADRAVVSVSVDQPLLRSVGALVNREPVTRAESAVAAARRALELRRADLVVQVAETYENLLRLQRQTENDRQTLERLDRFRRLAEVREKQGRATRVDAMRAGLRVGDARLRLNADEQELASARAAFAELLAAPPDAAFAAEPVARMEVRPVDGATAAAVALSNRLDYAQVLQDMDDARRGVRIARRNLLPDLRLLSRYERSGKGSSAGGALDLGDRVWFVGLSVDSDFPRASERVAAEEAAAAADSEALRAEAVRAAIERQVRQALVDYRRACEEIPMASRNHDLARARARLARRLFELGRGDGFTVSEAEDELRDASARLLSAEATASGAAYRLIRVMGTLVECPADLKPGRNG